ncbi:MAG: radical SAM protein [Bacteroidales bacterium]|nr:radical SAM protein [Bacteroidales bacterium]
MLREKVVFGPIFSRRLGQSLGVNLLPENGKLCNFDCIYCECGWNRDGRSAEPLPSAETVRRALEEKLQACVEAGTAIDSITFSGDGEPTLNPEFPRIVRDTLRLRDRFCPQARVSVLSNATRLDRDEIVEALRLVDNPILKLDAPTTALARLVNQPAGDYDVERVIAGMERFKGGFVLQTMFLKGAGFDWADPAVLEPWMEIVRRLRPREVMVYTLDRPAPQAGLEKYSEEQMRALVQPLLDDGFSIQIKA